MRKFALFVLTVVFGFSLCLSACQAVFAQKVNSNKKKETQKMSHAKGTFEVKIAPQPDDFAKEANLGRMTIDKQFAGDLTAISKGEMLSAMTETKGSAGYVAIERVTGVLQGRKGSFALLHQGIMNRGVPTLSITVVPDSGEGELIGIKGEMKINIEGGNHSYEFIYSLPNK